MAYGQPGGSDVHVDGVGGKKAKKKRLVLPGEKRDLSKFRINFISAVDRGAQAEQGHVLLKRDGEARVTVRNFASKEDLAKYLADYTNPVMLSAVDGHTHLLDDSGRAGETTWSRSKREQGGHQHPWIRNTEGEIVIGEAEGHTHSIAAMSKGDDSLWLGELTVEELRKRQFSTKEREKLAGKAAMADGSFPIATRSDLRNAIAAFGRAKNQAAVARHIKRRARALGATDMLPKEGKLAGLLGKDDGAGKETGMADNDGQAAGTEEAAVEKLTKERDDALAKAGRMEKILALPTDQRAHFDALSKAEEQDAFLALPAEDRASALAKAADADPVVYKSKTTGREFRKSDGEHLVELAKQNDELAGELAKSRAQSEQAALEKRAGDELPHLKGSVGARAALLKAVDGIADEAVRKEVGEILKAKDLASADLMAPRGVSTPPAEGSPVAKFNALAKSYAEKNGVSVEKASLAVLDTPEGQALYNEAIEAPGGGA